MKKTLLKSDKYKKARGGSSRLLEIVCVKCKVRVCLYQKDGPGMLKRLYLDRMMEPSAPLTIKELRCSSCQAALGMYMIYEQEQRPAYRLVLGAVGKRIVGCG